MPIVHIVLFAFKPSVEPDVVEDACARMLALKNNCIHPTTRRSYIVSSVGGRDNSPEGHQGGFTHGFVFHFENEEDRRYYLEEDPAHLDFVKSVGTIVHDARVLDFTPGLF